MNDDPKYYDDEFFDDDDNLLDGEQYVLQPNGLKRKRNANGQFLKRREKK